MVSRRKEKAAKDSAQGSPAWIITYADMVTLLLTFFIMLFSFSTVDAQKWQSLVAAMQGNISVFDGGLDFTPKPGTDDEIISDIIDRKDHQDITTDETDEFYALYKRIDEYITSTNIQAEVDISQTHTEILIRFRDYILFDVGKADIRDEAERILDDIAVVLKEFDDQIHRIRVDGHTDSMPINTLIYPTNWELSGARASRVVRYLQEKHQFPGYKLSFNGFGEHSSIDTNETAEGRARNRRVDILIVKSINEIGNIE